MPESLKKANLDRWDSKESFTKDELAYLLLDLEPQYEGSHPVIVEKIINIIQYSGSIFGEINSYKNNKYSRQNIRNWAVTCGILELIPFLQTRKQRNVFNGLAQDLGLTHDDEKVFIHDGSAIKIINQIPINFSKGEVREFPDLTDDNGKIIPRGYIQTDNPLIYQGLTHIGVEDSFIINIERKTNSGPKVSNTGDEHQEGTKGVTVTLPHSSRMLEAIFELMWKHWGNYDPSQRFHYPEYQLDINDRLRLNRERDGKASNNAKTIAAILKPDNFTGKGGTFRIKS